MGLLSRWPEFCVCSWGTIKTIVEVNGIKNTYRDLKSSKPSLYP